MTLSFQQWPRSVTEQLHTGHCQPIHQLLSALLYCPLNTSAFPILSSPLLAGRPLLLVRWLIKDNHSFVSDAWYGSRQAKRGEDCSSKALGQSVERRSPSNSIRWTNEICKAEWDFRTAICSKRTLNVDNVRESLANSQEAELGAKRQWSQRHFGRTGVALTTTGRCTSCLTFEGSEKGCKRANSNSSICRGHCEKQVKINSIK